MWRTQELTGRKVPTKVHLVDCETCEGVGSLIMGHANDPHAPEFDCADCNGRGQVRCADDGCCDFDPPEND